MRVAKALARLRICAGLPEPWLLTSAGGISTKISSVLESDAATGTTADLKPDTQQTDTKTDNEDRKDTDKPKVAKKPTPKPSEETKESDSSEKPSLFKEKETVVVQPGKSGVTDSGQGDSQA